MLFELSLFPVNVVIIVWFGWNEAVSFHVSSLNALLKYSVWGFPIYRSNSLDVLMFMIFNKWRFMSIMYTASPWGHFNLFCRFIPTALALPHHINLSRISALFHIWLLLFIPISLVSSLHTNLLGPIPIPSLLSHHLLFTLFFLDSSLFQPLWTLSFIPTSVIALPLCIPFFLGFIPPPVTNFLYCNLFRSSLPFSHTFVLYLLTPTSLPLLYSSWVTTAHLRHSFHVRIFW